MNLARARTWLPLVLLVGWFVVLLILVWRAFRANPLENAIRALVGMLLLLVGNLSGPDFDVAGTITVNLGLVQIPNLVVHSSGNSGHEVMIALFPVAALTITCLFIWYSTP